MPQAMVNLELHFVVGKFLDLKSEFLLAAALLMVLFPQKN
jgi:hypothetical protein